MSRAVGLVIPRFSNPVYAEIIEGAHVAAGHAGHALLTGTIEDFLGAIAYGRVDRLLIAGVPLSPATIARLDNSGVPWLLMNSRQAGVGWTVSLDDEHAAALAVRHLHDLGHRHIAHLRGPEHSDTARRRENGFRQAMAAHGLEIDAALMVSGGYAARDGSQAIRRLIASGSRFSAVFAANLASAIGAIRESFRQGLRVPQDVSVIGVHDLELADHLLPSVTTVRMPLRELGYRGVEMVLGPPGDHQASEIIRGPIELVVRESTARSVAGRRSSARASGASA
jgi:LacI family transcriptional regulator